MEAGVCPNKRKRPRATPPFHFPFFGSLPLPLSTPEETFTETTISVRNSAKAAVRVLLIGIARTAWANVRSRKTRTHTFDLNLPFDLLRSGRSTSRVSGRGSGPLHSVVRRSGLHIAAFARLWRKDLNHQGAHSCFRCTARGSHIEVDGDRVRTWSEVGFEVCNRCESRHRTVDPTVNIESG